jgi:hypothetical protein
MSQYLTYDPHGDNDGEDSLKFIGIGNSVGKYDSHPILLFRTNIKKSVEFEELEEIGSEIDCRLKDAWKEIESIYELFEDFTIKFKTLYRHSNT